VVGVVGDTRDYSKYITPQPTFYRALQKEPGVDVAPMFLVVRAAGEPGLLYKPICEALKAAGSDFNMPQFINLHERLWNRMAGHRALMLYLGLFAGVGLGVAAIGLYGVLAYSVERRTREIGIRMALGGQRGDMLRLILAEGARLVCVGVAFGLLAAFWLTRFLQKQLFEVSPTDPVVFAGVVTLLLAVAALACLIPALRASRIAPMTALRYE
jgi:ABC-type antimicrobial peptide transport system permease subunit